MDKKVFADGVYDISNEEYHASAGLSRSALWVFKDLPIKYWHRYLSERYEGPKPSASYYFGSLLHIYVLEPHKFDEQYYLTTQKWNKTTKVGKAGHAHDLELAQGKILVAPETHVQLNDMWFALKNHPQACELLNLEKNPLIEQSIYWTDPSTGIQCKARPDLMRQNIAVDLKSCEDASPRAFQLSATKNGYYLQAAMIYEAMQFHHIPFLRFAFVCVEKTPPYAVAVYILQDDALQYGLDLLQTLRMQYRICNAKNEWPDYGVNMLGVPGWALNEVDYDA